MDEDDFEGTLVLEKLAEIGQLEAFLDAVDADNSQKAQQLMYKAGVDQVTIQLVLEKMKTL
jgi:hypothetical protein